MKKLLLILILLASSAYGEIYTWKDSRGTIHYTNSEYEIPVKYRSKAKVLNLGIVEKKDNSTPQHDATSQQNTPAPQSGQVQPAAPAQPPAIQSPAGNPVREQPAKRMHPIRSREE
jgi:hypothetical protein